MLPPAPEQRSGVNARSAEKWARPQSASAAAQLIAHGQRETGPGIQTQGDWTNCGLWPLGAGAGELYAFVAIFGYSRMLGVRFATDKTRSTTLRSIVRCVDDLGGSSVEFLTDRDTALMNGVRSDGSPIYARSGSMSQPCSGPDRGRAGRTGPRRSAWVERVIREVKEDFLAWLTGQVLPERPSSLGTTRWRGAGRPRSSRLLTITGDSPPLNSWIGARRRVHPRHGAGPTRC